MEMSLPGVRARCERRDGKTLRISSRPGRFHPGERLAMRPGQSRLAVLLVEFDELLSRWGVAGRDAHDALEPEHSFGLFASTEKDFRNLES